MHYGQLAEQLGRPGGGVPLVRQTDRIPSASSYLAIGRNGTMTDMQAEFSERVVIAP